MSVNSLVQKYSTNRSNYIKSTYNETLLRSDFLDPFFELLGWDIKNTVGKATNEREVLLEEALKGSKSEQSKKPDYTFRLFAERKFFLEAKKPSVAVESDAETAHQVRRYGFTAKLKISVLSNFEYLLIYDCSYPVKPTDSHNKGLIAQYHYTEYEAKFEEIKAMLGRDAVYSGAFDDAWKDIESRIKTYSVDSLFLRQINEWRVLLATEIIKYEPGIPELELNDFVQSYLNRILFLRVCEDRYIEQYKTLFEFADKADFKSLISKFKEADKKYNSGLFDQHLSEAIIENISSVFWQIIRQLYFPESPYSFQVFSSDILGNIYEIFLSEKVALTEEGIKLVRKPENVDKDIVTTPTFIINAILKETVVPYCNGKTDIEILSYKFADIACGSGAFLLELYQLLTDTLIDYYLRTDQTNLVQTGISTYKLTFDVKRRLLLNCVYGTDKDYNAVEAAKFGLLLKLLEDENDTSLGGVSKPVLPGLAGNIYFGNSLIEPDDIKNPAERDEINPFDYSSIEYDVIVGNPPYMPTEGMKKFTPLELPIYKQVYESAYKQFDKYFLFIEQGYNLLKEGGLLGYIVPSKFYKVGAGQKLRKFLTENRSLKKVISFGANQVFEDKTNYTCLLIIENADNETFEYAEVKKLSDWRVGNLTTANIDIIETASLDNEGWALVTPDLKAAYGQILAQSTALDEIVGEDNIYNGIQTSANTTYIFTPIDEKDTHYFFENENVTWKIEKEFTRPYYKTTGGAENLYTYRPFKPNARVIYPYHLVGSKLEFYSLAEIQASFPEAYKYLMHYKPLLAAKTRSVKPDPTTPDEWHRYGRSQALESCEVPAKLIVGVLSQGNKYAIDFHQTLISSGGTAGYCMITLPAETSYSIYYIQALLNSKYLEWFSAIYGEVFRGGYIARGTKILKRLPVRTIDFADPAQKQLHDEIASIQGRLIQIQAQIDQATSGRTKIPLQRQFDDLKSHQDSLLNTLYNLGAEDSKIPFIKEIYS